MAKDAIPAIPPLPRSVTDPQSRAFFQAIRDALATRAGQTKNKLDYSPTIRELRDAGIIDVHGQGVGETINIGPSNPGTPFDDITVPDAPTGVIVNATPWNHHVQWDTPLAATDHIMSHAEVWFSDTNDRDTAVLAGTARLVFSVAIEPEAHKWYWVRFISYAGIEGAWSHTRYNGVEGKSDPDPGTLLDWLTGQITEGQLYQTLNDRIDYIDITDGGLVSRMTTAEGDIVTHTGQIGGLDTRVTTNEGDISANTTLINGVRTDLTTAEGNISANATSLSQHDTRITQNADDITVESGRIDQVNSTINDPDTGLPAAHAGVETNATAIANVEGDVTSVESKYTVKVDANGYVAGYGLIATSNGDLTHSEFGVSVDRFWIGSPGDTSLAFVVDQNRVVMDAAFIKDATITGAKIGNAAIDTAHIGSGAITEAKIENAAVTNAKIGSIIQSSVFNPAGGEGWSIDKSGSIQAAHIQIYDHTGSIIIDSGRTYTNYNAAIENSKQKYNEISDLPAYLDYAAFSLAPMGVYGNIWFEQDQPTTGQIKIRGTKLYQADGTPHTITDDQTFETWPGTAYQGFMFFTPRTCATEFPGWADGTNHRSDWFFLALLRADRSGFEVYDGEGGSPIDGNWLPKSDTPIVATLSRSGTGNALTTFNSLMGANLDLPEDGATKTGNGNMLVDGMFERFSNIGNFTGDPNWGVSLGSFKAYNDPNRGWLPYVDHAGTHTLDNWTYCPCRPNEPVYAALDALIDVSFVGTVQITLDFFTKGKSLVGTYTHDFLGTNKGTWADESFVSITPTNANYVRAGVAIFDCTAGQVYIDTLYVGTSPATINVQTTSTFIKDLSVNTLQIANQAVSHPEWFESTASVSAGGTAMKLIDCPYTPSEPGVPVLIHFSVRNNTSYGDSGSRYTQIRRDGALLRENHCFYESGGGSHEPNFGLSTMYTDYDHGGATVNYEIWIRGSSCTWNSQWRGVSITEMKK